MEGGREGRREGLEGKERGREGWVGRMGKEGEEGKTKSLKMGFSLQMTWRKTLILCLVTFGMLQLSQENNFTFLKKYEKADFFNVKKKKIKC